MKKFILFAICLGLLHSCSEPAVLELSNKFEDRVWNENEKVDFVFNFEDTLGRYDLILEIEHDVDFAYQNFYTKISTKTPESPSIEDEISFQLATKSGLWLGDCTSDNCSIQFDLQKNTQLKRIGEYQISLMPWSREDDLNGITALTFKIINSEPKPE